MVHISEKFLAQIKQEAEKAYPNECCGFIFGSINGGDKYAENILTCTNSTADSEQYHRFVITPEDMLKAEKLARSIKADIIGFYHSHPDCAAVSVRIRPFTRTSGLQLYYRIGHKRQSRRVYKLGT